MTGTFFIIIINLFMVSLGSQFEGDKCLIKSTNEKGKCVSIEKCDYAIQLLKSKQRPQHCGFEGFTPIVCCPLTTTPIPGDKSEKQCAAYHTKLPNIKYLFGGKKSLAREFPHMAILGYGDKDDIQWLCGGTLISEKFVLTAAHCIIHRDLGLVRWVRLGDLDIKNESDDAKPQDFTIITPYVHPDYRPYSHYHDIALLKLDRDVKFDSYVKPACLYGGMNISEPLIATGWGKVDDFGETSSHLMMVDLNYISFEQCTKSYTDVAGKKLISGIIDEIQICAGHPDGKDTCPGDSGGPLQFKSTKYSSCYYVVGITSFGKACGTTNSVGVYTRVAQYIDWIEDIVWPVE